MTGVGVVRRLASALAAVVLFSGSAEAVEIGFTSIELDVTPIDDFTRTSDATSFGALEFRGGVVITSPNADFGALSGLDFAPDGSLVAVADTGFWFSARPVERNGRLVGLDEARLAPILDENGKPVTGKRAGDAEGLRLFTRNGRLTALVSFERRNDLRRFIAAPEFASAAARPVRLPKSVSGLPGNAGLEAVAIAPEDGPFAGAMVLVAERALDQGGNHRGWIVGGPRAGAFSLTRSDDFDVTDAAFLPGGDLLVLERSFSFLPGVGMRIRRIAAADLLPGETVDSRVLIEADMLHQIDNMEGMALRPGDAGETLITLVSDDNKSAFQRTIFLQFALAADAMPRPRMRPDAGR